MGRRYTWSPLKIEDPRGLKVPQPAHFCASVGCPLKSPCSLTVEGWCPCFGELGSGMDISPSSELCVSTPCLPRDVSFMLAHPGLELPRTPAAVPVGLPAALQIGVSSVSATVLSPHLGHPDALDHVCPRPRSSSGDTEAGLSLSAMPVGAAGVWWGGRCSGYGQGWP